MFTPGYFFLFLSSPFLPAHLSYLSVPDFLLYSAMTKRHMKYAGIETYDKRIVASLIEKEVLGSTEIYVIWKHQDEYDRILGLIS